MAKKRTLVPFYGKINQRMERKAAMMTQAGDQEGATAIYAQEKEMRKARKPFETYGVRKLSRLHPDHPYRHGRKITAEEAKRFES